MLAGVVCEGATDYPVIKAILLALWPELEEVRLLQPDTSRSFGGLAYAGHTAVKTWCHNHRMWLAGFIQLDKSRPFDILVIHLDADIAAELGVQVPKQPSAAHSSSRAAARAQDGVMAGWARRQADEVRSKLLEWLNASHGRRLPCEVVFAVPVAATETWLYAAHRNGSATVEERKDAHRLLSESGLADAAAVTHLKDLATYEQLADGLSSGMAKLRRTCPEASRFCDDVASRRAACLGEE